MEKGKKNCPYCGEVIMEKARKCKHCGTWLDGAQTEIAPQYAVSQNTVLEEENGKVGCLMTCECVIILGILAVIYNWNYLMWIVGSIVMAFILHTSRIIRIIISIVFSALWGMIAVLLCPWLLDESEFKMTERLVNDDYSTYWYVGIIVFVFSLICHGSSMKKINF
ncbi:MAG: hypothetical protein J5506_08575 [Prevotella sp.]|nr:hypothetical protein [Prevotella sp.]